MGSAHRSWGTGGTTATTAATVSTTGSSHSFDAVFDLGLQTVATDIPASMPWPNPTYGMNVGNALELNWGPTIVALFYSDVQHRFNAVRNPCSWDMTATANGTKYRRT